MNSRHVVITGSTRGIGLGLARTFLDLDCSVTISGRDRAKLDALHRELDAEHPGGRVLGVPCDVTIPDQVDALWKSSLAQFSRIDIWVNNAGFSGDMGMVWDRPKQEASAVVSVNILGTIFGSQIAMEGMIRQGFGSIYNLEGMGSDGRKHAGLTLYGTTKYAVHYFTQSLALEAKNNGILVGGIRPGMVITDMIRERYRERPKEWERARRIFDIIAERVDIVTPWMARQMLANQKNGRIISYTSNLRLLGRLISSLFVKRNITE